MEVEGLVEQYLDQHISLQIVSTPLPDGIATIIVERLKREADRYWAIDPNCSLEYADRIIAIGRARNDKSQVALGLMARGDALKQASRRARAVADQRRLGKEAERLAPEFNSEPD